MVSCEDNLRFLLQLVKSPVKTLHRIVYVVRRATNCSSRQGPCFADMVRFYRMKPIPLTQEETFSRDVHGAVLMIEAAPTQPVDHLVSATVVDLVNLPVLGQRQNKEGIQPVEKAVCSQFGWTDGHTVRPSNAAPTFDLSPSAMEEVLAIRQRYQSTPWQTSLPWYRKIYDQ